MRDRAAHRNLAFSLTPILMVILLGGCGKPDRRPPGYRLLQEKHDKMRLDMTLAEVDALMSGHARKEKRVSKEYSLLLQETRPSVLSVSYYDKANATEGDYVLNVRFDKDGRLLGMEINEILK